MANRAIDTAQALAADLNAQSFMPDDTSASVEFVTWARLRSMSSETYIVSVTPDQLEDLDGARGGRFEQLTNVVTIAKRVSDVDTSTLTALLDLELDIRDRYADDVETLNGGTVEQVTVGGGSGFLFDRTELVESGIFVATVEIVTKHAPIT